MFSSRKLFRQSYHTGHRCLPTPSLTALILLALTMNARADLEMTEAVRLALVDDPRVSASQARAQAFSDNAVADGQLPDPKLKTGIYNLPVDDFDINREPTTQWRLGVVQAFPRGDTIRYKQRQSEWMATSEQATAAVNTRMTTRDVRTRFLELYYQVHAGQIVTDSLDLFAQLVDITQAQYATGRVSQQDVLSASLELSRLDDRITGIHLEEDRARAALKKWLGETAYLPINAAFPTLPALPEKEQLQIQLPAHPVIRIESARLEAKNQSIKIAREQYKPGWSAGLEYRKRFGEDPAGNDRSDMMAAMVTLDLPLFTANRQDRRLAASIQGAAAAQLMRDERLRELQQQLDTDYANWMRLGERGELYESRLLREARASAQASLKAYQSGITEFTTLMRARIADLEVRLVALRVRVDRTKAHARLLYLAGEDQ